MMTMNRRDFIRAACAMPVALLVPMTITDDDAVAQAALEALEIRKAAAIRHAEEMQRRNEEIMEAVWDEFGKHMHEMLSSETV